MGAGVVDNSYIVLALYSVTIESILYTVKNVSGFPDLRRDVTNQTLPGGG